MKVEWLPQAQDDVRQIHRYIAERNLRAADRLLLLFHARAASLAEFPLLGRRQMRVYRYLVVHRRYALLYRLRPGWVLIARVLHTARNFGAAE